MSVQGGATPVLWILIVSVVLTIPATATTIHVPEDQPTIQAGINAASYGDTVLVACGTYYEHDIIMKSGVCLLSETGLADCVTIDGQYFGRVMQCSSADSSSLLKGFTITGGTTSTGEAGGGIYCAGSDLAITNCVFTWNGCSLGGGGAIACYYGSSPTITNCDFVDNSTSGEGGGICCADGSSPTITDCLFAENSASGGGGVGSYQGSEVTLVNCTFSENDAWDGGGVMCWGSSGTLDGCVFSGNNSEGGGGGMSCRFGASPTLTGCTFEENDAGGRGGGMYCSDSSPALTDVTFSGNTSSIRGGGLYSKASSASLTNVAFTGNQAPNGGGMYCEEEPSPTLVGCTFSDNAGSSGGGGVCCLSSSPSLTNVTFSGNSSSYGAGLYCLSGSSPTIANSIIAFGLNGEAVRCYGGGVNEPNLSCCDVYGNEAGDWVNCIADQYGINDNISEDPLFCDAPGGDFTLHLDSPCAPGNNPECGLIGAWGVGCGVSAVESASWGSIKAMFR